MHRFAASRRRETVWRPACGEGLAPLGVSMVCIWVLYQPEEQGARLDGRVWALCAVQASCREGKKTSETQVRAAPIIDGRGSAFGRQRRNTAKVEGKKVTESPKFAKLRNSETTAALFDPCSERRPKNNAPLGR
ncbi:hypothetical protein CALCODRAFT_89635 [Calocera cornea HHB12733]|uniref:Uncharacterized protein n=1 Tax=Calocera cornea HHB12733 TaxID=1353952 RepID=A0A165DBR6_9BASI|nr:hypothetical protein CALCODRAFT_89635 [Calocera cornea HHB12733]